MASIMWTQPEEAYISLEEASRLGGGSRSTLWRKCKAGDLPSRLKKKGARDTYEVLRSAILGPAKNADYEKLYARWVKDQESGYHTGEPMFPKSIEANEYGMTKFWEYLGEEKSLAAITPDALRRALSNVPINRETKTDHYSIRCQMYKGFRSFFKLLITEGLRTEAELLETKKFVPHKTFKSVKRVLEEPEIRAYLYKNRNKLKGRKKHDVWIMEMLIYLYAWAGMRREEAVHLKVREIDLDKGMMHFFGKGGKERYVPLLPELKEKIKEWLAVRRHQHSKYLLTQYDGSQMTIKSVSDRFQRFGDKDIHPHSLRRSCATILANAGMPMNLIQLMLGHADIKTTQGYILSNEKHMLDWVQNRFAAVTSAGLEQDNDLADATMHMLGG